MSSFRHKHKFTLLYTHFGPYHANHRAIHYHVCMNSECNLVLVGMGRECGGDHDHWRETLTDSPKETP